MGVSTLLLLVAVSCTAVQFGNGYEVRESSQSGKQMYLYTYQGQTIREKRAFSPFKSAWKALIKTTQPFKWPNSDGEVIKLFTKVGTWRNAQDDFYSFGPTKVRQGPHGLSGRVGNQIVRLFESTQNGEGPGRPMISVLDNEEASIFYGVSNTNRVPRVIAYQENHVEAKAQLRKWQKQFSMH